LAVKSTLRRQVGARLPDLIGGLLLVVAIASLALGLVRAPEWGWTGTKTLISFAVSAVTLPGFVWRSARHPVPVLDLDLLRSHVLSSASASTLLYFASFGILLLSSVLCIQGHWHYSAVKTGLSIAPGPCLVPIFATLSEVLSKRIRVGVIAASGCVVSAMGAALLLSSMGPSPGYVADFLPGWLLVCIGFALSMPTVLAAGTAELAPEQSATGSAVVNMATQVGLVLGISILVAVLGTASAAAGLHLFRMAWWIAGGSVLVAGVAALLVTPRRRGLSTVG
jgi:hypothetical protein